MRVCGLVSIALGTLVLTAGAAEWTRVAYDDAGAAAGQPHLREGAAYTYTTAELPLAVAGAADPARTVAFGGRVVFGYGGLKPTAAYKLRLTLLADAGAREVQLAVDGQVLREKLALPARTLVREEVELPALAYAYGEMNVEVSHLSGPNAVVSEIEVLSTDPTPLQAVVTALAVSGPKRARVEALMREGLPRLTPRPVRVPGVKEPLLSLNGTWKFNPAPAAAFPAAGTTGAAWRDIAVPGEWVMQGFTVPANTAGAYTRSFAVPRDWSGKRVKLRFDNVYSLCKVWVNGRLVGEHEGGFIPFEFDVTDAVQAGDNALALTVQNESLADRLASGSQYAAHSLGGIVRKVQLFAVPAVNLSELKIATPFDAGFRDAVVQARLKLANDAATGSGAVTVRLAVVGPAGATVARAERRVEAPAPGHVLALALELPVERPLPWDSEHPNLYTLVCDVDGGARVEERFGFRQVEVRGNQVFVNGRPIKWRGVCRHEVHPLLGRALNDALWRKDAELYRALNCNIVRTSHYPPAEEFIRHCDELGLFVELEAPVCWVQHGANERLKPEDLQKDRFFFLLLQANLATVQGYANHPSVIVRSLANESRWSGAFEAVAQCVALADPTRILAFHDQCWGTYNNAGSGILPLANYHYPGLNGPAEADKGVRPTHFGEYCHLNCYNRREIVTDPCVREDYGRALQPMYDAMYRSTGNVGGTIWSGIDDVFLLPDGRAVGYGEWGPLDGWRRLKPEAWHVQKSYSPVRIEERPLVRPEPGQPLLVPIENRFNFTDLREVAIAWELGSERGELRAELPARQAGRLAVPVKGALAAGARLRLRFTDPRGVSVDAYDLVVGAETAAASEPRAVAPARCALTEAADAWTVRAGDCTWIVDRKTGLLRGGAKGATTVVTGGPHLLILPLTAGPCATEHDKHIAPLTDVYAGWAATSVAARVDGDDVRVTVQGTYDGSSGGYELVFRGAGGLQVVYDFKVGAAVNPRQWGVVFDVAAACGTLAWERTAQWSCYPEGHIGRPRGQATSALSGRRGDERQAPTWPWEQDENALGSNDFRATRTGLRWATLCGGDGVGLRADGGGRQAARAWRHGDGLRLLVAGFHTGGADGFLSGHYGSERRPLKAGAAVSDTVSVQLVGP